MPTLVAIVLVIADLLLPGYAWILVSGLSKILGLLERITLSFILSICFSSVLAAALSLLIPQYVQYSIAVSLGLPILIVGVALLRRDSLPRTFHLRTSRNMLPLLIASLTYVIVILTLFWSAPYYPTAEASDLLVHTQFTSAIMSGDGKDVLLHSNYPVGLHFASAIVASLLQVDALEALRILASPILLVIIQLNFLSARALFGSQKVAGLVALVAAFAMPADAIHFIRVGTFPNIMSDALALTIVWLFFSYLERPSLSLGITMTFLGLAGAFVHSSFLIFLALLWVSLPVVFLRFKKRFRRYLQACSFCVAGLVVFALLLWSFFVRNLGRILSSYVILGQSPSSPSFVPLDIIYVNLVWNIRTFMGPINVLAVVAGIVFIAMRQRDCIGRVFAVFWMVILTAGAFLSGQDWRFVLLSMLPAAFIVGNLITAGSELLVGLSSNLSANLRRLTQIIGPIVLVVLIISGSFPSLVPKIYNPSGRTRQAAISESMVWLKQSACSNGVASVGLWPDYQYLPALTGIPYVGDFNKPPDEILSSAASLKFTCVAVSTQNQYLCAFETDAMFREEYRNSGVMIFFVAS